MLVTNGSSFVGRCPNHIHTLILGDNLRPLPLDSHIHISNQTKSEMYSGWSRPTLDVGSRQLNIGISF